MVPQNQKEKADLFLKLHADKEILILLNAWDPGSSKLIEASGLKAIATTSMGISASLGYPDCEAIPFSEMTDAIKRIVDKVNVPVTADIEAGYGKNIPGIVEAARKIISTGIVGINIEDSTAFGTQLVEEAQFCETISALRKLSDSLGMHLVINARTDCFFISSFPSKDVLKETVRRGNKYREAGADCVFVPNVWERDKISLLVKEIAAPLNILLNPTVGAGRLPPSIQELEQLGVARVSFGSSLMKSTLTAIKKVADEVSNKKTYQILINALEPMTETSAAYRIATGMDA